MDKEDLNQLLGLVATTDNLKLLVKLIDQGADVNHAGDSKMTAVWSALLNKRLKQFKLLVEKGADLNIEHDGHTLLSTVINNRNIDHTKLLLKHGCDYNMKISRNENALYMACRMGNKEIMKLLLECPNIDINCVNDVGNSILSYVCYWLQDVEIAEMLLNAGADPNIQIGSNNTPLIEACINTDEKMVELLLKQPTIDITIKNAAGRTALDCAKSRTSSKIINLLETHQSKKISSLTPIPPPIQTPTNKSGKSYPMLIPIPEPKPVVLNVEVVCMETPVPILITIPPNHNKAYYKWNKEKKQYDSPANFISSSEVTIEVIEGKMLYHDFPDIGYVQFYQLTMPNGTVRSRDDLYQ